MKLNLTTQIISDYLLIKAEGEISDFTDLQEATLTFYEEIAKSGLKKAIIDELDLVVPDSIITQLEGIKYYSEALPVEVKTWKIAVVVQKKYEKVFKFWETASYNRGFYYYRCFTDLIKAKTWIEQYNKIE